MLSSVSNNGQTATNLNSTLAGDTPAISDMETLQKFAPTEPIPTASFWLTWGWPAILDLILGRMALKRLAPLVPDKLQYRAMICVTHRKRELLRLGVVGHQVLRVVIN